MRNICVTSKKDDTTKAEIIWAAKTANDNYTFRSSDGIGDTFTAMFSNPETLETFSMSRTKLSYVIGHGIGPVFKEELISDVRASHSPFSLQYHETTQCQVKKQMKLHIRYWSLVHNEVWIRYYTSEFFGHAEGATVASAIVSAFRSDNVPLTQLLTLGSDRPNVNKTIWRKMEQKIRKVYPGFQGLADVSSRHIRVLGQFQINKKLTSKQTQQTQQQTFPSFPHNLHFFPTAKPNATYIFVLILANDELFEFCVSCVKFGGNMKVFVEFVLRLIFVDLKLSQNPYMPTTYAQFSVREKS